MVMYIILMRLINYTCTLPMHNVIAHEFKKSKTVWYVIKRWIATHVDLTVDGIMDEHV